MRKDPRLRIFQVAFRTFVMAAWQAAYQVWNMIASQGNI